MTKQHGEHHYKRDVGGFFADEDADLKTIRSLQARGYTPEAIAKATGIPPERVRRVLAQGVKKK